MLLIIGAALIIFKILELTDLSWTFVLIAESLLLIVSVFELRYIYRKIDKKFK